MHRDPLQSLVQLVATEANPHHLMLRVASESFLLESVQRLCQETGDITADRRIMELCLSCKIPIEYFQERLQVIARILNLIPYEQNYYEILGLSRSATPEEIKQSFRRLSFSSHPDINPDDPDAAERFRNIQHAYEVLRNDKLHRSYDQNLETRGWAEEKLQGGKTTGPVWWRKWRRAWPVGALFVVFMLITLVIDYREWQTARYYKRVQTPPARQVAPASSPPPSVPVQPVQEIVKDSAPPLIAASLVEPVKPPSIPETPPTLTQIEMPPNAAPMASVVARNDDASPKNNTASTGEKTFAALPAVSPKPTTDAKQLPQKLLPASEPGAAPSSGEPEGKRSSPEEKPAGPTATHSAMQQTAPSTRPGDAPVPLEPMERLHDLDRKIHAFLSRYANTYETKNSVALLGFFEADAVENGKPIQNLAPVYRANFRRAEKLRYQIKVRRWEEEKDGVKVDGSFRLSVQFWDEAPVESTGSIQLTLVWRGGDFGVKRLDYSFKKSAKSED